MPPKFKRHLNDDEVTGSVKSERVSVSPAGRSERGLTVAWLGSVPTAGLSWPALPVLPQPSSAGPSSPERGDSAIQLLRGSAPVRVCHSSLGTALWEPVAAPSVCIHGQEMPVCSSLPPFRRAWQGHGLAVLPTLAEGLE